MALVHNVSSSVLHPEYQRLLSGLPYAHIKILAHFSEGRSGAPVLLVDISSLPQSEDRTTEEGLFIAKIVQIRGNSSELKAHNLAKQYFNAIPSIVNNHQERLQFAENDSQPKGTYLVIIYKIAQGTLKNACTMRVVLQEQASRALEYIDELATQIYHVWKDHVNIEALHPMQLLSKNMLRTLMKGGKSITNVAQQTINLDQHRPFISVVGTKLLLPNPVAYAENEAYWQNSRGISFPLGPIHGDLHFDNIICLKSDVHPMLIDFAGFDPSVCVFYDLVYLELCILLHLFTYDRTGWQAFVRHLAGDWQLKDRRVSGSIVVVHAAEILKKLRRPVYQIAEKLGREEDFEIAFQLTVTAIGLNYMRKLQPDSEAQINALLYAAYGLRRALALLKVAAPEENEYMIAYPRPGAVSAALNDLQLKFSKTPWLDDTPLMTKVEPHPTVTQEPPVEEYGDTAYQEPLIVDMDAIELSALAKLERSLAARRGRDLADDTIAEFAELIAQTRRYLRNKRRSSGTTKDEETEYNRCSAQLQRLCLRYFGKTYNDFIEDEIQPNPSTTQLGTDNELDADSKFTREQFVCELNYWNEQRDSWLEKQQNELDGALAGNTNTWILRELHRIDERIQQIKRKAPAAWFDVYREFDKPLVLLTEQPVHVTIIIQNLGREKRRIEYIEHIPAGTALVSPQKGNRIRKGQLKWAVTIPPEQSAQVTYVFYTIQPGEFSFQGELNYAGQDKSWDQIPEHRVLCASVARSAAPNIERFYRYLPETTEILLKITIPPLTRMVQQVEVNEIFGLDGREHGQQLRHKGVVLPGESISVTYQIKGHPKQEDIKFSEKATLNYVDLDGSAHTGKALDTECKLLEYETLRRRDIIVARDTQIHKIEETVRAVSLREPDAKRIVHIFGSRGHGKSTLLGELEQRAEENGFRCVYKQVQRSSSLVVHLLVDVMQANIFDHNSIRQRIAEVNTLLFEHREKLLNYIMEELTHTPHKTDLNDWKLKQAMYEAISYHTEQKPLLIAIDDAHELQAVNELEFLKYVLSRFAGSQAPIIVAFAETTEYALSEQKEVVSSVSSYVLRDRSVATLRCDALKEQECYELIDRLIEYPYFDTELKEFVYKISAGVPQDIYDILRWLTSSRDTLVLRGDLWSKTQWFHGEEPLFSNVTKILPKFAEEYLRDIPGVFAYLQILAVVGELIPYELAVDLHTHTFPTIPTDQIAQKLDKLIRIDFITQDQNQDLRFTHLSRRNSIYEDETFAVSGRREEIRRLIFEIIQRNESIYASSEERSLQAAHHLLRCTPDFQKAHVEVLIYGAERAMQHRDLRLGRQFIESISSSELLGNNDIRAIDLQLLLAREILELEKNYTEALTLLANTEASLKRIQEEGRLAGSTHESLIIAIANIKASAYLVSPDPGALHNSRQLSMEVIEKLRRYQPNLLNLLWHSTFRSFPYIELLSAYFIHIHATLKKGTSQEHQFAHEFYIDMYLKRARRLAKWLSRSKNADQVQILKVDLDFCELFITYKQYENARRIYQSVLDQGEKYGLPFYEGRAYQGLARVYLYSKELISKEYPIDEILTAFFNVVIQGPPEITGKFEQTKIWYERALNAHIMVDDRVGAAEARAAIGMFYHLKANNADALAHYDAAISLYRELGDWDALWVCHLGVLTLLLRQPANTDAQRIWEQAYNIYQNHYSTDLLAEIPSRKFFTLEHFGRLARQLAPYFIQNQDKAGELQALEIQVIELPEEEQSKLEWYKLFLRQGDLLFERGDLPAAHEVYTQGLEYTASVEVPDQAYVDCTARLIKLCSHPDWHPNRLERRQNTWTNQETEYYFEALCIFFVEENVIDQFYETYTQFLDIMERNNSYNYYPHTYLKILSTLLGLDMADQVDKIKHFVEATISYLKRHAHYQEAAELLNYTGMRLLRSSLPVEIAEEIGTSYFKEAEELFMQADAIIYGLNGLLFGYLMFHEKQGFGRCAIKLLDLTLASAEAFEETEALLRQLLGSETARNILLKENLVEILNRLDDVLSRTAKPIHKHIGEIVHYKAAAHMFLGEKYQHEGRIKSCEREIKRALKSIVAALNIPDAKISENLIYNMIGLCYSTLGKVSRRNNLWDEVDLYRILEFAAHRESAKTNYNFRDKQLLGWAIDIVNLTDIYLRYPELLKYIPCLIEEAFETSIKACIQADMKLQATEDSHQEARVLVLNAAQARSLLLKVCGIWREYIQLTRRSQRDQHNRDQDQVLNLLTQEMGLLYAHSERKILIYQQSVIDNNWPLHKIVSMRLGTEDVRFQLKMLVEWPSNPSNLTVEAALSATIPGVPSATQILQDIRTMDIKELEQADLENEVPAPPTLEQLRDIL